LPRDVFDKELRKLQTELCHLQEHIKKEKLKVIVVFEGRDAAGKGGVIKRITERVSPMDIESWQRRRNSPVRRTGCDSSMKYHPPTRYGGQGRERILWQGGKVCRRAAEYYC